MRPRGENVDYDRLRVRYDELAASASVMRDRIAQLDARLTSALANEKAGWDSFYKLRKAVGEDRYPGMTGEVTAKETHAELNLIAGYQPSDGTEP